MARTELALAALVALVALAAPACASSASPRYTAVGSAGGAVVLVEERSSPRPRQLLVLCHPDRVPVCVRVRTAGAAGRAAERRWVESAAGAATTAPGRGRLSIDASPWCVVEIDGEPIGQTPIVDHVAPAGAHDIRCTNPVLHAVRILQATVRAGETTRVRIDLRAPEAAGGGATAPGVAPRIRDWPAETAPTGPTASTPEP